MNSETVYSLFFYLISFVVLLSAVAAVTMRNLVHAALMLALSFISVSGIYVLLQADFLAAVQLLIYGGAVPVLIVFGVMLTRMPGDRESNPVNRRTVLWGAGMAALLFAVLMTTLHKTEFIARGVMTSEPSIEGIARLMLGDFVISFEIAAVLLLAALLGAIVLARGGEAK